MLEMKQHIVKQLALSLNHQNSGDDKVPYLSVAYTMDEGTSTLSENQVDGLMGPCTYRSWFNINGADIQPMDWTKKVKLTCDDAFKEVAVDMLVNGDKELEFEGCRLYIDRFKLSSGGTVRADFHVHIIKHKEADMIQIRRAEFTEVTLSLGDGVVIERTARKQRQLPFEADEKADELTKDVLPESDQPAVDAVGRDETLIWWIHGPSGEQSCGKRCDMPAQDCVEIDPPAGCKSEAEQEAKAADPNDIQDFAAGAARAVGARKKRGSGVIDGRSERVKHQDRVAGRDDTH